jgi:predicted nucleotidyltransferase
MTASSDCFDRIGEALKKATAALDRARVPFLLGGSLAAWARGGPESCNDLDLMLRKEDADRALEALAEAGMRTEDPAEQWLYKAWDGEVLVDLIFEPKGLPIDEQAFARAEQVSAFGVELQAMALEDVMVTKLMALTEHYLDYEGLLLIARPLRERIDWNQVRRRTEESAYARAFFSLIEELGLLERSSAEGRSGEQPHVRLA